MGKIDYTCHPEDCRFTNEWDNQGWKNYEFRNFDGKFYNGYSWGDTIITKINQCSAHISRHTLRGGADTILVHPSCSNLIKSLEFYQVDKKKLGGRYNVIVTKKVNPDSVMVCRAEYFNLTHVSKFLRDEEQDYSDPICVPVEDVFDTDEKVEEYKRGLMACVKILNYK